MFRRNGKETSGPFIVLAWGGFLGGLTFLAFTHGALFAVDWCEGSPSCLREWVAALGGWVAAGAAGITVFVLVATLKHMQRSSEIQNQAYVYVTKIEFGAFDNIVVYCKNGGLTPATHFSLNGEARLVKSGNISSSIKFRNDGFKTWSTLGAGAELSVSLDADPNIIDNFRRGRSPEGEHLLVCGQVIYCTIDNRDHLTQFAFYVDARFRHRFRRPTSSELRSFFEIPQSLRSNEKR